MRPSVLDEPFRISVVGIARPQGSKSARIVRGRPILTDGFGDNPRRLKEWRGAIADAARAWLAVHPPRAPFDEPTTNARCRINMAAACRSVLRQEQSDD